MRKPIKPVPKPAFWRRWWQPAVVAGAGGGAAAVWFDEIWVYAEEILGLILLPILASVIFLLNILMFRSRMPREEDLEWPRGKGGEK